MLDMIYSFWPYVYCGGGEYFSVFTVQNIPDNTGFISYNYVEKKQQNCRRQGKRYQNY